MHGRRLTFVGVILLALMLLTACSTTKAPAPAPAPAQASAGQSAQASKAPPDLKGKKVGVVFNSSPDVNKIIPLHALHLLEQWGAKVDIIWSNSNQISVDAIIKNNADVMSISVQGALSAANNGVALKTFALSQPRQDYVFVTRPDVASLADLKGKPVGVLDMAGMNAVHVDVVLKAAGLTRKDINIVEAGGQGARAAALISGRLEGTMFGMANYLKLQKDGYHMLYSYTKELPLLVDDIWWAKPEWIQKNPDMAEAMNEALLTSFRWFNDPKNKDAFVKETLDQVKGSDANTASQMYDLYRENAMYPNNTILNTEALTYSQKVCVDLKSLPKELPVSDWADFTYAQKALDKLGKVGE